jgi:hypothetical protein
MLSVALLLLALPAWLVVAAPSPNKITRGIRVIETVKRSDSSVEHEAVKLRARKDKAITTTTTTVTVAATGIKST